MYYYSVIGILALLFLLNKNRNTLFKGKQLNYSPADMSGDVKAVFYRRGQKDV